MRTLSDWLENKLAYDELRKPIPRPPEQTRAQKLYPWVMGIAIAMLWPKFVNDWHWRPVSVYLLIVAVSAVAGYFLNGRRFVASWWSFAIVLGVGGLVFLYMG